MKNVIYTVLVGEYDILKQPIIINPDFDYICFSNQFDEEKVGVWIIKKLPCSNLVGNTRLSRYPKILPHKVLEKYDYSVYIDANIRIINWNFYDIIKKKIEEGLLICQVSNIFRDCIYKDIEIAYRKRKVDFRGARQQYRHLKSEQYPEHYGLFENNVILRKHNDPQVIELSEAWWREYCEYTHRDQFSLMYIYWKYNFKPDYLFKRGQNARNVECLELKPHIRKRPKHIFNDYLGVKYENAISYFRKYIWKLFK